MFGHHVSNSDIEHVESSGAGNHKTQGYYVVDDVHYSHITEAQTMVFFKLLLVTKQTLHSACECCFTLDNQKENVLSYAQFCSLSGQNGFTNNLK